MKKNLMKKVFAVSLSIAMACSFLPATNPMTASAAAPYVGLRTTFKTLKVNQSNKMTLKNNSLSWQVTKVTTSAKSIATVYGKDKKAATFYIKGKSEGRATISAYLKTTARKTNNTKKVSCRVKVVVDTPDVPVTPSATESTVKTQAELEAAIKAISETGSTINKLTIATDAAENFTIPAGSFLGVDLVVNAPNSDVTNNATFRSIEIQAIKDTTWTENAKGNKFTFTAISVRMIISSTASVDSVIVNRVDAAVALVVDGILSNLTINQKSAVAISGSTTTRIAVAVNATDTTLTTSRPVDVQASTKATLVFEKGAEDSKVTITSRDVTVSVDNRTEKPITVTKADGTEQAVAAGTKQDFITLSPGTDTPGTITPGTDTSTVTKAAIQYEPCTDALDVAATSSAAITGSSITVTVKTNCYINGNLCAKRIGSTLTDTITKGALEYRIVVDGRTVVDWKTLSNNNQVEEKFDVASDIKSTDIVVYCRIKESDTTQPSGQRQFPVTVTNN